MGLVCNMLVVLRFAIFAILADFCAETHCILVVFWFGFLAGLFVVG